MAEEYVTLEEVMNLMEAGLAPAFLPATGIPALREQLAILVSTGKCKEAIGVSLTHEQVRQLDKKEVMKHCKRYETYVSVKIIEALGETLGSFLAPSAKALIGSFLHLSAIAITSYWNMKRRQKNEGTQTSDKGG